MIFTESRLSNLKQKLNAKMLYGVKCAHELDGIPYSVMNGKWSQREVTWWTNGFWAAEMWQMFQMCGSEIFHDEAVRAENLMDAALRDTPNLHHDVGFMWLIQSGVHYALDGNQDSYDRTYLAANLLAGRYNPNGFIRAWNEDKFGWAIIDCMMNLNLLYWASRMTNDPRYRLIAMRHADSTMRYFIREDGSSNHIVVFNPETGEYIDNPAGQGVRSGSSWSRGQAWALYGFALAYRSTGKSEYLVTSKKVADYFISQIKDDPIPKCDFCQPDDELLYDDAAGAIAASGLIELSEHLSEDDNKAVYWNAAVRILDALDERDADYSYASPAILTKCTGSYLDDHHVAMNYADYFYIEALHKLMGNRMCFWAPDVKPQN